MISRSRGNRARRGLLIPLVLLLSTTALLGQQQKLYPNLDAQFQPLRAQFNRDTGKVRLLILLDPT